MMDHDLRKNRLMGQKQTLYRKTTYRKYSGLKYLNLTAPKFFLKKGSNLLLVLWIPFHYNKEVNFLSLEIVGRAFIELEAHLL